MVLAFTHILSSQRTLCEDELVHLGGTVVLKAYFLRSLSTTWGNVRGAHYRALIQTY